MATAQIPIADELDLNQLLQNLIAIKKGNFSARMPVNKTGIAGKIADTINDIIDLNEGMITEFERISNVVGKEGKINQRAVLVGAKGAWIDGINSINTLITDLVQPTTETARVIRAVANGVLSQTSPLEIDGRPLQGEFLQTAQIVNAMVIQLNSFSSEVIRVAREVGTDGKLGVQAEVKGVDGTWKDLTDSVNSMAGNLTSQLRNIAEVTKAVANGDLSKKITVVVKGEIALKAKGEIATLADTINEMIDTLATFADQVTSVAREVGIEGKLGGQAQVPRASGTWRMLTDNVNELASNLTIQVRAISEVSIAVTRGDFTRSITVEAQGEVAVLKDTVNQMIANLRETTQKNADQDWLKTNLAKITRMLQGQRDLEAVSKLILSELAPLVSAQHGVFYLMDTQISSSSATLKMLSSYAYRERKHLANQFHIGEGLVGQCALEKERILLTEVPSDYIKISSGLGEASPLSVVVLPVVFEQKVTAVIELASFHRFSEIHLAFLDQLTESIGIVLNMIIVNMRTDELLKQSQSLAEELQTQQNELRETNKRLEQQARSLQVSEELLKNQQEQLQQTNEELKGKARLLAEQNKEVERKNHEIELARLSLEEKAEQLALTSKYKSEFLANMSHELRTPLNSLLILARLLSENGMSNLNQKQVEYAQTIYGAGNDLLALINDILDLAKIESGTSNIEIEQMPFAELENYIDRNFRQLTTDKNLSFNVDFSPSLPSAIYTDAKRLQQILKNLLSNAIKFTEHGEIRLQVEPAALGWNLENENLNSADLVIAFSVTDTGIGIPVAKQKIIFEAFQQADGTTSRKYGGTGLGLSISRELTRLLGGEITLVSQQAVGSTFTLYLGQNYTRNIILPYPKDRQGDQKTINKGSVALPLLTKERSLVDEDIAVPPILTSIISDPLTSCLIFKDDRENITEGDRLLLIVEDNYPFAAIVLEEAHNQGFKAIVALDGETALNIVQQYQIQAIILDIGLPVMDGWKVLDRLKHNPKTQPIPVYVITIWEGEQRSLEMGAIGYLQKPVTTESIAQALRTLMAAADRTSRNLLVIENNPEQRQAIIDLLGNHDIATIAVSNGETAIATLETATTEFDCILLNWQQPDFNGFDLIKRLKLQLTHQKQFNLVFLPIIVYRDEPFSTEEKAELKQIGATLILEKDGLLLDRILSATNLFLHRDKKNLSESTKKRLEQSHPLNTGLIGRKVLIIDDDVRNIFALTSMLEFYRIEVIYAENGRDGIAILQNTPDINVVLMDMMMPDLDGYETIRNIRQIYALRSLPIIALTAKAMLGDREKCIEAGASDYIPKPVNTDRLLSLLRVWLY